MLGSIALRRVAIGIVLLAGSAVPSYAQQGGQWRVNEAGGDVQVGFFAKAAKPDDDALLVLSCDKLNATLKGLLRTQSPAQIEAAQAGTLTVQATGGGQKLPLTAYVARAPGEEAIGLEAPLTFELAAVLGARDVVLDLPGLRIVADAKGVAALSQLIAACPEAPMDIADDREQYRPYLSAFGAFGLDVPTRLFRLAAADRNGRSYRSALGHARLDVLVVNNSLDEDVRAAFGRALADKDIVAVPTYKQAGKDFFVISGKAGKRIVYYKALLTCQGSTWASLRLEYDDTAKSAIDPIVTRLSRSMTPRTAPDGTSLCE